MDRKTRIIKIVLDVLMTIAMILLMSKLTTGMLLHEIIGISILIVAIIHNILNVKWIKAMTKNLFAKEISVRSKILYIINLIAFIVMLADVVTGILISESLFPNIQVGNREDVIVWHKFLSYWLLIIISIHIGLHWDMVINLFGNLLQKAKMQLKDNVVVKITLKLFYVAIAIAGIVSLAKPDINNNFLLQNNKKEKDFKPTDMQNQVNNTETNSKAQVINENSADIEESKDSTNNDKKTTTNSSTTNLVTVDEVSSLQDYLGKLYCTGCGRHCPLTNPQCAKGESRQEQEVENYNQMYGTNENYSSSNPSSQGVNTNSSNGIEQNTNQSMKNRKGASEGKSVTSQQFNEKLPENGMEKEKNDSNLFDYVWIMGFVVGGTYYVAKLPKVLKTKEDEKTIGK